MPSVSDVDVLRELAARRGFARANELPGGEHFARAALKRWRQNFGAAEENKNGEWRLAYRAQFLQIKELNIANAVVVGETASTNDVARRLPPPAFVFAEHQTAGRGRRGRKWLSLPGGAVLFSAHLAMRRPPPGLTVAVGVGLWRALNEYADLKLKWPNDLLDARGRKVGGVLAEANDGGVVVGVGINLHVTETMSAAINRPAAGLADVANKPLPSRAMLSAKLADAVRHVCEQFGAEGLSPFLPDALRAHLPPVGSPLTITGDGEDDAGESAAGVFAGFADDGALLIKNGGGVARHLCGEIRRVACG